MINDLPYSRMMARHEKRIAGLSRYERKEIAIFARCHRLPFLEAVSGLLAVVPAMQQRDAVVVEINRVIKKLR